MYALIDCNNFFVSCERLFRPDLEGKPVIVLSNNDGCFISRSAEAKALGLPMGAPVFKWKQELRLHDVVLLSANFELYGDISQRISEVLREVTPLVEVYSIDECFLDLSQLSIADHAQWAQHLQARVQREVGIPVSIGVAPTKTLAKVATTYAKTHGGCFAVVDEAARQAMLRELPIEDIWGLGWRSAPRLREQGISTAEQLLSASDGWLSGQFNSSGMRMIRELRGEVCLSFGDHHEKRQTIMRSRSFGQRVRAYHLLENAVSSFAAQAAQRLRRQDSLAGIVEVALSARDRGEARARTHLHTAVTLDEATADTARLISAALHGLGLIYDEQLLYDKAAVTLRDIHDRSTWQLSWLAEETRRDERQQLMGMVDGLNKRFGKKLYFASERGADTTWQSKHERRSPRYTTEWSELPRL